MLSQPSVSAVGSVQCFLNIQYYIFSHTCRYLREGIA